MLTVVPEMVTYGPTATRADHWKSLSKKKTNIFRFYNSADVALSGVCVSHKTRSTTGNIYQVLKPNLVLTPVANESCVCTREGNGAIVRWGSRSDPIRA